MLSFEQLSIFKDDIQILKDLSICYLENSIIELKGPNGSGKTSLLEAIIGIGRKEGKILYKNRAISDARISYLGHELAIKPQETVIEYLTFWGKIYDSVEILKALIYQHNLNDMLHYKCSELSQGMLKRLAISKIMLENSDIWLLDEPEVNLDNEAREILLNMCEIFARSKGIVIIASHNNFKVNNMVQLNLENYKCSY